MSEVMWRVGTNPWTFLCLVLALGCWCLVGAFVPQTSLTELGFRSGGSSVQTARLFHAHAISESWITWLLVGLLFCNALGLFFSRKGRVFKLNILAIICSALALLGSIIGQESGTIWVRENLAKAQEVAAETQENVHQSTDFMAESRSGSAMRRVELPFRLRCEPAQDDGVHCVVEGDAKGTSKIVIPSAGKGATTLMGYDLALIGSRPVGPNWQKESSPSSNNWIRLGRALSGPILKPGEVLELSRGQEGEGKVKLGAIKTNDGGALFIARSKKTLLGVDIRVNQQIVAAGNAEAPLKIKHVLSPRWLKLAYQRPSPKPMNAALFNFGPFLLLISVLAAALGLSLRDEEEGS